MIREAEDVNKHSYNENYIFSRVYLLTRFSEGRVAPFIHGTLKHLCTTSPQRLTARCVQFISVHFSHSTVSDTLWTAAHQTSLSSPTPRACTNSCPLSRWCHPTISSSVIPFSSCFQSYRASVSLLMGQLFASGGQRIEVSASASDLPMNIQDWFPLEFIGWISLQSKGLSRVFSNTTVQKHQFFSTQLSLESNSHIHTWPLEQP